MKTSEDILHLVDYLMYKWVLLTELKICGSLVAEVSVLCLWGEMALLM
jgi:hypothetical protein